jgi:hypothetical protein
VRKHIDFLTYVVINGMIFWMAMEASYVIVMKQWTRKGNFVDWGLLMIVSLWLLREIVYGIQAFIAWWGRRRNGCY